MNNKEFKSTKVRFPKYVKSVRNYTSNDGEIVVDIDKNGQLCGGTFMATHKGRPCLIENGSIMCPVTVRVYNEDLKRYECVFSHYETILGSAKPVRKRFKVEAKVHTEEKPKFEKRPHAKKNFKKNAKNTH